MFSYIYISVKLRVINCFYRLPSSIIWFEPPLVAHWIPEKKIWSTQDVHDIKYNEEKQTIMFRTGRLGVHGLATFKFINIPFQSWELKPEIGRNARGGIVLNVTAAIVQAEFIVRVFIFWTVYKIIYIWFDKI